VDTIGAANVLAAEQLRRCIDDRNYGRPAGAATPVPFIPGDVAEQLSVSGACLISQR
jgi:hypothetical protein